jgi:hypothetical protein
MLHEYINFSKDNMILILTVYLFIHKYIFSGYLEFFVLLFQKYPSLSLSYANTSIIIHSTRIRHITYHTNRIRHLR